MYRTLTIVHTLLRAVEQQHSRGSFQEAEQEAGERSTATAATERAAHHAALLCSRVTSVPKMKSNQDSG